MTKTLVEQFVEVPQNMRLYQQERAIYEVTGLIENAMEDQGISRSELAVMLKKSKSWVTQLLDGEGNKTVRTVADALAVLGHEFRGFSQPIQISNEKKYSVVMKSLEAPHWEEPWNPVIKIRGHVA